MNSKYIFRIGRLAVAGTLALFATSCNKYLDREPLSSVSPDDYLNAEADLATYTITRYDFPSHDGWGMGTFSTDNHTDNQANSGYATRWVPGEWRVPSNGGDWSFDKIYQLNYFLETVVPKWHEGAITGNNNNIEHYIGEGYFLRAYEYFNKVQAMGDFPILRNTLKDDLAELTANSVRQPRNEVARFMLADLDSAIHLLNVTPPNGKNRISKNAALLLKSRIALHEGSWLRYHRGTAFVPGGPNWPGTQSHPDFSIDLDQEIDFFLAQAMDAASLVADGISLEPNAKDDGYNSSGNRYFSMFGDTDLESYDEVLLWRNYSLGLGIIHNVNHYMNRNGGNSGYTRGLVESFTMANGLPIYASGSGYQGDDYIEDVKKDRDNRLQIFMKAPGELRYTDRTGGDGEAVEEGYPDIIGLNETKYVTGYGLKKGVSYLFGESEGSAGTTGSIIFRATEAYLNYIEASYLKNGSLDATATRYWQQIRDRAGVNTDFMLTVNNTSMQEEAKRDFAAYSAGQLLSDPILFNIRRERRLELMAEGLRYMDLKRWKALDQLAESPYMIEGIKIWGPMQDWYEEKGTSLLIEPNTPGRTANVSSATESSYLRPYRINLSGGNLVMNGYSWIAAHYLSPIAANHFTITSESGSPSSSTIYQNPGWPRTANQGATN